MPTSAKQKRSRPLSPCDRGEHGSIVREERTVVLRRGREGNDVVPCIDYLDRCLTCGRTVREGRCDAARYPQYLGAEIPYPPRSGAAGYRKKLKRG